MAESCGSQMTDYIRFRAGFAKYRDLALLPSYLGESDSFEPPTYVMVFDETAPPEQVWGVGKYDNVYMDVATWDGDGMDRPAFVTLSEEGEVLFHTKDEFEEDIPDAGVWKETAKNYGHLGRISQFGEHLFAWGWRGQVYRRARPNQWEHFDQGLLDPDGESFNVPDMCLAADDTYYAVTSLGPKGRILFRRENTGWIEAKNPTGEWLNCITPDKDGTVWIAGKNGTLLHGNESRGFTDLSGPDDHQEFYSIALFGGKVWLATNTTLYTYDGKSIAEVDTGLEPPLRSPHRLQAIDGVLWSFGYDDVARYDGEQWTRFICPAAKPFSGS